MIGGFVRARLFACTGGRVYAILTGASGALPCL